MYIVATFRHSIKIELAVNSVRLAGVSQTDILVIPLQANTNKKKQLLDTIDSSDGKSLFDLPMILAAVLSLYGCIYGFVWPFGPIFGGLAGIVVGLVTGLIIKLIILRKDTTALGKNADVVMFIACSGDKSDMVRSALGQNGALGIGTLDMGSPQEGGSYGK